MGEIVNFGDKHLGGAEQGPTNLKPGAVIVHCVLEPDSGRIQMHRSERNPPPRNNHQQRVEYDNWFTIMCNCAAILIGQCEQFGLPRKMMIDVMNRVVNTYLDSGGTGGHRKRVHVELGKGDKEAQISVDKIKTKTAAPSIKIDFDDEIISLGYEKLGNESYLDYCGRVGAANRDKMRKPIASEFAGAIVFRKAILSGPEFKPGCQIDGVESIYLEIGRDKELISAGPDDATTSRYLVSLVLSKTMQRKFYWQVSAPDKIKDELSTIEAEAIAVAKAILF